MKKITSHAAKRLQQRAIAPEALCVLELLGIQIEQKGGTYLLALPSDRRKLKRLRSSLKNTLSLLDRDVYAIGSNTGHLITVGHRI
jgi:hypothetical protein